jgi:Outer membrane protein (OmpH-like).
MYKNFFFFFFFVIFFVSKTYSSEKIVVVDIQFLVDNSIAGKFLDKKIEKLDKANFDYFQKKEKNFAEKEKKIISQKNVLSDSEYQDKVKNFKEDLVKYNKEKRDKIENLKKTRDNLYKKLFEK